MHSVLVEHHLDTCTGAVTVRHFLVVNNTTIKVILGLLKCKKQSQILLLRQKKKRSKESTSRRSTVHLAAARGTLIPSISVDKTRTGDGLAEIKCQKIVFVYSHLKYPAF